MKSAIIQRPPAWRLPAALLALFLAVSFTHCGVLLKEGNKSGANQRIGALLLQILGGGCTIGSRGFRIDGEISCQSGIASGTGFLSAFSDSPDVLSVELTFQLEEGGELELIGGAAPPPAGENTARGHGFFIRNNLAQGFGPEHPGLISIGSAGTDVQTWCLEIHTPEPDVHLIADPAPCPSELKSAATAAYESESDLGGAGLGNGPRQGLAWGFRLNGAAILNANFNIEERFGE